MENYKTLIKENKEIINTNTNFDDNYMIAFFDNIKNVWEKLSDHNKKIIWRYIKSLSVLSENHHKLGLQLTS